MREAEVWVRRLAKGPILIRPPLAPDPVRSRDPRPSADCPKTSPKKTRRERRAAAADWQLQLSLCGIMATPIALGFGVPREHT